MGFHIACRRAGRPTQFPLHGRFGNRIINAKDRRVLRAVDGAKQLSRPGPVGFADGLRFVDGGSHDPVSRPQAIGESAGDTEADHAAIALADGAPGHGGQLLSIAAADDQNPGACRDAGLESHADERNDKTAMILGCFRIGDLTSIASTQITNIECRPREIRMVCHQS
jgi:hypothetical protein